MDFFDLLLIAAGLWLAWWIFRTFLWPSTEIEETPKKGAVERLSDFIVDEGSAWWRGYLRRQKARNEYTDLNLKYWQNGFLVEEKFRAKTLLNFNVEYRLNVVAERVEDEEFKRHRMLENSSRQGLAEDYNQEFFIPFLNERSCFFTITTPSVIEPDEIYQAFQTPIYQLVDEDGKSVLRELFKTSLQIELAKRPFTKKGCKLTSGYLELDRFSDAAIEENYAMLTDKQKEAVITTEEFGILEEMLAVAVLRRRLDFLGRASRQQHQNEDLRVETEKAGRGVRIRWEFKNQGSFGYELLGYRKTGGFHSDPWGEDKNGALVIHAGGSGEVVEFLDQGQANFYTLVMQEPSRQDDSKVKRSALRFQITIAPEKEMEAINAALSRAEQRTRMVKPVDPDKEHIAQAIRELGLFVELDAALEAKRKTWEKEIEENKEYTAEERAEKIERLRDTMTALRSKYEP